MTEEVSNNENPVEEVVPPNKPVENEKKSNPFGDGFGKGISRGKEELLHELGVNSIDDLKTVVSAHKEFVEKNKNTEEKLLEISSKHVELESNYKKVSSQLQEYIEKDKKVAEELYDSLHEEDRKAVDLTGLPKEKTIPLLQRLVQQKNPNYRTIGSPVAPSFKNNTHLSEHDKALELAKNKKKLSDLVR